MAHRIPFRASEPSTFLCHAAQSVIESVVISYELLCTIGRASIFSNWDLLLGKTEFRSCFVFPYALADVCSMKLPYLTKLRSTCTAGLAVASRSESHFQSQAPGVRYRYTVMRWPLHAIHHYKVTVQSIVGNNASCLSLLRLNPNPLHKNNTHYKMIRQPSDRRSPTPAPTHTNIGTCALDLPNACKEPPIPPDKKSFSRLHTPLLHSWPRKTAVYPPLLRAPRNNLMRFPFPIISRWITYSNAVLVAE